MNILMPLETLCSTAKTRAMRSRMVAFVKKAAGQ